MSVNIDLYEDTGPVSGGRGTTITNIVNWNLKANGTATAVYYPTDETTDAPLIRPRRTPGAQTLSYKKYLSFKIDGTYARIKNMRIKFKLGTDDDSEANTDQAQLFYKLTNTYQVPDDSFDGDMLCVSTNGEPFGGVIVPFFGASPQTATTRQVTYGPDQELWTCFIVVQMRVNNECIIGNSSEFYLSFECSEY